MKPKLQKKPFENPWPLWMQVVLLFWRLTWLVFCRWTPKFFNPWRLIVLKTFGAKLNGCPFIHSSAKVQIPWNLRMEHRACLGEGVDAYSLGEIEIQSGATVAQDAYICTGTHDFTKPSMQLITKKIIIGPNSFIGARAMILPGVKIGKNSIIGAQAVVTKDTKTDEIVAGNPAKIIGKRTIAK